jgi:hypothetical protein
MPFRFASHQLHDIVKAVKWVRPGQSLDFEREGTRGMKLRADLELPDGPLMALSLHLSCHDPAQPEGYTAALVLEGQRIRGIDYSHIERKRFYKKYIEKGWHENIIDPNLRPPDDNRHPPLVSFQPTDLTHFLHLVAQKWNIVLPAGDLLI